MLLGRPTHNHDALHALAPTRQLDGVVQLVVVDHVLAAYRAALLGRHIPQNFEVSKHAVVVHCVLKAQKPLI